jgi:hypothetical protein
MGKDLVPFLKPIQHWFKLVSSSSLELKVTPQRFPSKGKLNLNLTTHDSITKSKP